MKACNSPSEKSSDEGGFPECAGISRHTNREIDAKDHFKTSKTVGSGDTGVYNEYRGDRSQITAP